MKSVDHKMKPPIKKYVRANTIISSYLIKKIGNNCELGLISQTDIKGKVPRFIINALAPRVPIQWLKTVEKALKMYGS